MDAEQPLTRTEARALLQYAEATYRSVTASQRRIAAAALALTVVFALLCLISGVQWLQTRSRVAAVVDAPLVEALGVEIADPRPALERMQLRVQALAWGGATGATGLLALLLGAIYLVARPPAPPDYPPI